jgi:hypothetical protein
MLRLILLPCFIPVYVNSNSCVCLVAAATPRALFTEPVASASPPDTDTAATAVPAAAAAADAQLRTEDDVYDAYQQLVRLRHSSKGLLSARWTCGFDDDNHVLFNSVRGGLSMELTFHSPADSSGLLYRIAVMHRGEQRLVDVSGLLEQVQQQQPDSKFVPSSILTATDLRNVLQFFGECVMCSGCCSLGFIDQHGPNFYARAKHLAPGSNSSAVHGADNNSSNGAGSDSGAGTCATGSTGSSAVSSAADAAPLIAQVDTSKRLVLSSGRSKPKVIDWTICTSGCRVLVHPGIRPTARKHWSGMCDECHGWERRSLSSSYTNFKNRQSSSHRLSKCDPSRSSPPCLAVAHVSACSTARCAEGAAVHVLPDYLPNITCHHTT